MRWTRILVAATAPDRRGADLGRIGSHGRLAERDPLSEPGGGAGVDGRRGRHHHQAERWPVVENEIEGRHEAIVERPLDGRAPPGRGRAGSRAARAVRRTDLPAPRVGGRWACRSGAGRGPMASSGSMATSVNIAAPTPRPTPPLPSTAHTSIVPSRTGTATARSSDQITDRVPALGAPTTRMWPSSSETVHGAPSSRRPSGSEVRLGAVRYRRQRRRGPQSGSPRRTSRRTTPVGSLWA